MAAQLRRYTEKMMKLELNSDQIFEILNEWCKKEHSHEVNALQWQVEEEKEFKGVLILYGPA